MAAILRPLAISMMFCAAMQPVAAFAQRAEQGFGERGVFAGARLRIGFGARTHEIRGGLALASVERDRDRGAALRFGPAMEVGLVERRGAWRFSLADLPQAPRDAQRRRSGLSSGGWIAVGAGTVLVGVVAAIAWTNAKCDQYLRRDC